MSSLVGAGDLTGLGKPDVKVSLKATAVIEGVTCTNKGQQLVEAQPKTITIENIQLIPSKSIDKNGRASFNVATSKSQITPLASGLFCPNNNWTATIDTLRWRGVTVLTAVQPDQTLTLNFNCNQPNDVTLPFNCTPQ
jgi:hypothetical protein